MQIKAKILNIVYYCHKGKNRTGIKVNYTCPVLTKEITAYFHFDGYGYEEVVHEYVSNNKCECKNVHENYILDFICEI